MENRYARGSEEANKLVKQAIKQWFPALEPAIVQILFDTKKRMKGNKLILGQIRRANDLIRRLTDDICEEGCDYIMFLDRVVFENISKQDKMRLVRHELRHCKVEGTPEKPKYKVVPHDIEDFEIEIELNKDNVGWAREAAQMALEIYAQMADDKKDKENA